MGVALSGSLAAVITYGLLAIIWGTVLWLYVRSRRLVKDDPLIRVLLVILALDAFKSVVESVYFGLLWAANYGVISETFRALGDPNALTVVKLLNVVVAVIVLMRLARSWVPSELERRAEGREAERRLRAELEANLALARDAEERLRLAVSAASDFIWDVDLRTGAIFAPAQVATWLGYPATEWPPKPWYTIVHKADRARVLGAVKEALKGTTTAYDVRHRVLRKDGTVLHVHSKGLTVRDAAGRAVRFVGAVRDISAEVEASNAHAQTQKLEGLGLLAGGVAHDFNNLMGAVSASLELARRGHDVDAALETAALAVERATMLTRQLLAYAGKGSRATEPVDLNQVVSSIDQLLTLTVPRKVRLERALTPKRPLVLGDESQLQQVVMNLITNAADAIGDRPGVVKLSTELLTFDTSRPGTLGTIPKGEVVRFSVQDDGAGLSAETQARIFDPFFSTKGAGRGLGLSALAGILRAHGGAISVESQVGVGSTFSVYLPVTTELPASASPAPSPRPKALSLRVLVVDDEPFLRRSACRLLASMGCTVVEAPSGTAAVEVVRSDPARFDVVLMDLTMPELDGLEASKLIHALVPSLPIVLSSGYSTVDLPDGNFLTLPKPYSAEALEATLRRAVTTATRAAS